MGLVGVKVQGPHARAMRLIKARHQSTMMGGRGGGGGERRRQKFGLQYKLGNNIHSYKAMTGLLIIIMMTLYYELSPIC